MLRSLSARPPSARHASRRLGLGALLLATSAVLAAAPARPVDAGPPAQGKRHRDKVHKFSLPTFRDWVQVPIEASQQEIEVCKLSDGSGKGSARYSVDASIVVVRVPKGEGYARVEGARGEVGCYIVSDGGPKPYRLKWRGASFSNLAVLPHIVPGHKVADVVAIMGSVDPVFGEVDR